MLSGQTDGKVSTVTSAHALRVNNVVLLRVLVKYSYLYGDRIPEYSFGILCGRDGQLISFAYDILFVDNRYIVHFHHYQ